MGHRPGRIRYGAPPSSQNMTPELLEGFSLYPDLHPHTRGTSQPLHTAQSLRMPGTFPWPRGAPHGH